MMISLVIIGALTGGAIWFYTDYKKKEKEKKNDKRSDFAKAVEIANQKGEGVIVMNLQETAKQLRLELEEQSSDPEVIMDLLLGLSEADFYTIFDQFGKRRYNTTSRGTVSNGITDHFEEGDLAYWLKKEVSPEQYQTLKNKFPNRL